MSTKRWRMVISDLAGDTVHHEVTVEAENWMTALRKGRSQIGETGGVPTGSSCAVAPDGRVTLLDPIERRRFILSVDSAESFRPSPPAGPRVPADEVPRPQSSPPPPQTAPTPAPTAATSPTAATDAGAETAPAKKRRAKTMAYIPPEQLPAAAKPAKRAAAKTMAYIPPEQLPRPSEVVVGAPTPQRPGAPASPANLDAPATSAEPAAPAPPPKPAAEPAAPALPPEPAAPAPPPEPAAPAPPPKPAAEPAAPAPPPKPAAPASPPAEPAPVSGQTADAAEGVFEGVRWVLNTQRDAEPSAENPLCYRERTYAVPPDTTADVAEAIARERLASLQAALRDRPPGKFLNLAIFDHSWSDRPARPPLVTIQFKDWQGAPVVDRPLAKASPAPAPPPGPRRRASTDENDARLADAFEACQDLLFLSTPLEALEFVAKLVEDLIPSEALGACLYDIDDDAYRTVVATGPGSDARRAQALPSNRGLLGAASALHTPLRVDDPQADERFDPELDGRPGLTVRNLLYLPLRHGGRTLGMLQLLNRTGAPGFSASDVDLAVYIGGQLSQFLYEARIRAGQ